MSFRVTAHYFAQPEKVDEIVPLLKELAQDSRGEPDNIDYVVAQNLENESHFVITETYTDEEGFAAHRDTEHFQNIGVKQIIPLLENRIIEQSHLEEK